MGDFLKGWLQSDAARRDSIDVKRIYIDVCGGNLIDAVMLSQIMYWHEPGKGGKPKLTIRREGHLWLAKRYEDWWEECRVPKRTARDSINRLVAIGLLIRNSWFFEGRSAVHLRINPPRFKELVAAVENGTIGAVRARLIDASRQSVNDASRQSVESGDQKVIDATRQSLPSSDRRETALPYTETTEITDDDVQIDPDHHQDFRASADVRNLAQLPERFETMGIAKSVWSKWAQPVEHQLACVLHAQAEGSNPSGLLRTMLDGDGVPLAKYVTKAQQILSPASLPPPRGVPPPPPAPKGLDEQPGGGLLTARDIWQAVVGQLKLQLNQDTYAYVRDAQLARFENGVFTIRPRLPYAARWFERSRDMLDRMISDIAGITLEVRCEGYESGSTAAIPAGFADPEHIRHKECNT